MVSQSKICLLEDDLIMGESLVQRFELEGVDSDWFKDSKTALDALTSTNYSLLISDIRLPDGNAETMFGKLVESGKNVPPTLFITGYGSVKQAVRLLQQGSRDYITKPFSLDELLKKIRVLCPELFAEDHQLPTEPLLGVSPAMLRIQKTLSRIAVTGTSVLITGESGVGKEHVARYLYESWYPQKDKPFIVINCAAMTESLLEAELFGYDKGAFTGAQRNHRGVFERANGGALFLDEIGETSTAMQAKLLRVLQEGTLLRLGSERPIQTNIRLIFATNKDLKNAVENGDFREDLYFRINVIQIKIPSLKDRKEDIVWFARRFVSDYVAAHGIHRYLQSVSEQTLVEKKWPGNIRELKHTIERACILSTQKMISPGDLEQVEYTSEPAAGQIKKDLKSNLQDYEKHFILETLIEHDWRITDTADNLGISRKNLWEKMRKYGIQIESGSES